MATYDQGDVVRCAVTLTDSLGNYADPTALTFKIKVPNGSITTYVYGTNAELVRVASGRYYVDVSVTSLGALSAGTYYYRFEATGTNAGASEGSFTVSNSGIYG